MIEILMLQVMCIVRIVQFKEDSAIVYKHWSVTREFIKRTVELWKRWIRLSCYYNKNRHVSIVYKCNTYFVMHWSL